ncbi:MAG TPA: TetR/AcrR family transcriptional regulator [Alphaproteobacteria bacterium]|nr:TetR/AcrR family transcriptional regulator [Alphaproteobacteria bacterium]
MRAKTRTTRAAKPGGAVLRAGRPRSRAEAKVFYRARMMEAAIEGIARHGFSGLSVSRLVEYSGLSRGMVNLHFERKQALLLQVLKHLADVYRAGWQAAVERAGDDPAARLAALVEYDVMRDGHPSNTLTAWLAFRQEAITNPVYRPLCDTREAAFFGTVKALCAALIRQGRYKLDPEVAALGITYLLEGLWLDWAIDPARYSARTGRAVCRTHLAAIFPKHFGKRA